MAAAVAARRGRFRDLFDFTRAHRLRHPSTRISPIDGAGPLLATAYAAARHTRHLSLYCVVWACYVPGYLEQTGLGAAIEETFRRQARLVTAASLGLALLFICETVPAAPWRLTLPATNADATLGTMCYPVGAVRFLKQAGFRGNLMLPFEVGGYAIWNLYPNAKVSIDGRYEVAYQPEVLEEHLRVFQAEPGWQALLAKYPTDAVMMLCLSRLSAEMPTLPGWRRVYRDGVYEIYTRPGFSLPAVGRDVPRRERAKLRNSFASPPGHDRDLQSHSRPLTIVRQADWWLRRAGVPHRAHGKSGFVYGDSRKSNLYCRDGSFGTA